MSISCQVPEWWADPEASSGSESEHEDVAPNPREANTPDTIEVGVARGRRERQSREEFNIKLARPPARP